MHPRLPTDLTFCACVLLLTTMGVCVPFQPSLLRSVSCYDVDGMLAVARFPFFVVFRGEEEEEGAPSPSTHTH